MSPEAKRSFRFLRYAQLPEARADNPIGAMIGELDYLIDLLFYQPSCKLDLNQLLSETRGDVKDQPGKGQWACEDVNQNLLHRRFLRAILGGAL